MVSHKTVELLSLETVNITYDDFDEYADHLEVMEDRGYKFITVTRNPNNDAMLAKYERIQKIDIK